MKDGDALPSAIVFDLDGTLIDSWGDLADAVNEVLTAIGEAERPPEQIKKFIGHGVNALIERSLGERATPERVERGRSLFKDAYAARLVKKTTVFPGIMSTLERLNALAIPLLIATNKPSAFTNVIVHALGLDRAGIRAWASADEAGERKPNPRVAMLALERAQLNVAPSSTFYVGDMPVDMETARRGELRFAGVAWGFDPAGLRPDDCDAWMERPEDLSALRVRKS